MKLFVGLGNPGPKYTLHRHNVGFMAVDAIADDHGFGPARKRFQSETREGALPLPGGGQDKVLVLKPTTYMNESGRAVGEAARFFRLEAEDVFVFHDELDLDAGRLRCKQGGGNAGHNGLKSISAHLGNEFWRVRIGIGHPGHKERVSGHVLGDFAKAERDGWVADMLDGIAAEAGLLLSDPPGFVPAVMRRVSPPALPGSKPSDTERT